MKAIRVVTLSDEGFEDAFRILKERFGNKKLLHTHG